MQLEEYWRKCTYISDEYSASIIRGNIRYFTSVFIMEEADLSKTRLHGVTPQSQ